MKRRFTSQVLGGLLLIGIGGMFLLRQMGYTDFSLGSLISTYWPVILIVMGVQRFLAPDEERSRFSATLGGFIYLAIGVFFLGRNLDWFYYSASDFFKMLIPVMLIGGGLSVIFRPRRNTPPIPPAPPSPPGYYPPGPGKSPLDTAPPAPLESTLDQQFEQKFGKPAGSADRNWNDYLHKNEEDADGNPLHASADTRWQEKQERQERRRQERQERHARRHGEWHEEFQDSGNDKDATNRSAFIGDVHMGKEHFQLKRTNISQFIGDTVLDLTNAQIPYGETKINISAFVGDIKVYIPDDMDLGVSVNGSSFIGDMQVLEQSRSGFMSNVQCKTPYYKESGKKVRINVSCFIGDVKVKTVG
ncbi:cell wall-active antibiotics response protein LiaF [Paenibacillus sp. FSL P2-0089]|uniref:cell wall-active antibiotics response protein LiaF n=1 Tax=Paenibacillus sp. FSL P2-0089 TaxID=2954526 RepID=UPI00315ACA3D